jgi:AraC-like DNA-binding protein
MPETFAMRQFGSPARAREQRFTAIVVPPQRGFEWTPSGPLAPFVASYTYRDDRLGLRRMYNPLPARADCFLQFYFADRYQVVNVAGGGVHRAASCVLVGPHTRRREDLLCTGHLKMFTIHFTPVGFSALFDVPVREIRDVAGAADLVLGAELRELEARLTEVPPLGMLAIAETYLFGRLARTSFPLDGGVAARVARVLQARHGAVSIGTVAEAHGLSVRQVERLFREQVGMSPKVFARLARLRLAMQLSVAQTAPDWAGIADAAGYFDQSHMVREFGAFNGATPVQFLALRERAGEFLRESSRDVAFVLSDQAERLIA